MMKTMNTKTLNRGLMVFMLGFALLVVTGCKLSTPEIRGIVLDEETGEPVEGAWITSSVTVESLRGSSSVWSVAPPHLRTGKDGRFVVPSRGVSRSFSGAKVLSFGVSAMTADWRGGGVELKDKLGKRNLEVTVIVKDAEDYYRNKYKKDGRDEERINELIEQHFFSGLQSRYKYCLYGRASVERSIVEGGCDAWELDYVIEKHERFLERLGEPKTADQESNYVWTREQLGYLHKKKGDYKKALSAFEENGDFFKEKLKGRTSGFYYTKLRQSENQIQELEGLLKQ